MSSSITPVSVWGGVLEAISSEQLRNPFDVNVFGTIAVCQAAIRRMRARRAGLIINVTSLAGRAGLPFLAPYCAGKFAVEGLTESLLYELQAFGIRVKLVEPGGIRSQFSLSWIAAEPYEPTASASHETMKRGGARAALPEVVAKTVIAAANDASDRLRYRTTDAGMLLAIRRLLPDFAWRTFVRKVFGNGTRLGRPFLRPEGTQSVPLCGQQTLDRNLSTILKGNSYY